MYFLKTVVEFLANLFDVDEGAGVTVLATRFCPPSAEMFLLAFSFVEEVCLLVDVAESNNKVGKRLLQKILYIEIGCNRL